MNHQSIGNRRAATRIDASAMPTFKCISRIGGPKVKLINISRHGALIEDRERLSTGSTIALRVTMGKDVYFIKGRIVRCKASYANKRIFQSGIAFKEDLKILPANINEEDIPKYKALA